MADVAPGPGRCAEVSLLLVAVTAVLQRVRLSRAVRSGRAWLTAISTAWRLPERQHHVREPGQAFVSLSLSRWSTVPCVDDEPRSGCLRVARAHACRCSALGRGGGRLCRGALRRRGARPPGKARPDPGVAWLRTAAVAGVHGCERLPHTGSFAGTGSPGGRPRPSPAAAAALTVLRGGREEPAVLFVALGGCLSSSPWGPHHMPLWVSSARGVGFLGCGAGAGGSRGAF